MTLITQSKFLFGYLLITALTACGPVADSGPVAPPTPEILGAGTVSLTDRHEFCATLSQYRRTIYIGIEHGEWQSIVSYDWDDEVWVGPENVLGTPEFTAQDPYLTQDERRLYFITKANGHADIAFLEREEQGSWKDPVILGSPVNSPANEYYTSFTAEGDLIFASDKDETERGDYNIYRAQKRGANYLEPVPFPAGINTLGYEADPYIDPERRYMIFASNRAGGQGRGDIYISFATSDGGWSEPIPFDETINTPAHQLCPLVSLDGSALIFTSDQDIHWVSTVVIETMLEDYRR